MRSLFGVTFAIILVGVCCGPTVPAGAQENAPRSQKTQASPKESTPTPDSSAPKDDNPFPEDVSRQAAGKQGEKPETDPKTASQTQTQTQPGTPAQPDDNSFPEDVSRKAAERANAPADSNTGVSSSAAGEPESDREPERRKLSKPSRNVQPGSLTGLGRAKEDLQVGSFYLSTGDYKGAYARFGDASRMDPTNLEAIFGLAESARHLDKPEEAKTNYQLYLAIAPDGKEAKSARKALSEIGRVKLAERK